MLGLMQNWPLTVDRILDHAKTWHSHREVVSRSVEGPIVRSTYGEIHDRAKKLSNALLAMNVKPGDRIATLAWNTGRHLECWYGIMGIGAVCHTLNPRLFPEQLVYIINHAEDRVIFTDLTFLPVLEKILAQCPTVEQVVVLSEDGSIPQFKIEGVAHMGFKGVHSYESVISSHSTDAKWGGFDENTAAGLCYTSGTTGNPKGVLYSHRTNFLHTLTGLAPDVLNLSIREVVLPVVPLFHANAWGLAFDCPAVGAKMVMPGPKLDGASIYELMETEGVTFSAGVPTVWQMLLQHMDSTKAKFSTLKRMVVGGSALPESILRGFQDRYDVEVTAAWGMTETSPLGTVSMMTPELIQKPYDEQVPYRLKGGRAPLGVELKITNDAGERLPNDGHTFGRLKIRGMFIAGAYFKNDGGEILDDEGFFDTGDVATLDSDGFMSITDRAKDVIKSGGEWISSIDIENIAAGHPKAAIAAVIGVAHPKWDERPLLLVKLKEGETATAEEFLTHLEGKIAKWWMPDDCVFVDDIPLGATGKIDKKVIRKQFEGYVLPSVAAASGAAIALAAAKAPMVYAPDPEPEGPPTAEVQSESPGEPEAAAQPQAPSLTSGELVEDAAAADLAPAEADAPAVPEAVTEPDLEAEPVAEIPPAEAPALDESQQAEARLIIEEPSVTERPSEAAPGAESEPAVGAVAADSAEPAGEIETPPAEPDATVEPVIEQAEPASESLDAAAAADAEREAEIAALASEFAMPADAEAANDSTVSEAAVDDAVAAFPASDQDAPPVESLAAPLTLAAAGAAVGMAAAKAKARSGGIQRLFLALFLLVALAPAVMVIGGAILTRFGVIDWKLGYRDILLSDDGSLGWAYKIALAGIFTGVLGLLAAIGGGWRKLGRLAVLNILITAASLTGFAYLHYQNAAIPPVHDVATDWDEPLAFSDAVMAVRGAGSNPVDADPAVSVDSATFPGRHVADLNADACPGAKPVIVRKPPEAAFDLAKSTLTSAGLTVTGEDRANGRLEATASSLIYGFKDDVVVRIRQDIEGARLDLRSVSRARTSDLGANCVRVTSLVKALRT
ncbi:long-chain-fatty-acid--CoA ligase [soil metagenome]